MHGTKSIKIGFNTICGLRKTLSALISVILMFALFSSGYTYAETSAPAYRDTEGHWASSYIAWAVDEDLANGYEDGTFQPDKPVTEAEFMAMLLRAYGVMSKSDSAGGSLWYQPFYDYANGLGWPVSYANVRGSFLRGQAALLMATAVRGAALTEREAIEWLLDEKISKGRTSATVEGYAPKGGVTRAEALTFLYMLKQHSDKLSTTKLPAAANSLFGIAIGDSHDKLIGLRGQPDRVDPSDYAFKWHVYTGSGKYDQFAMYGILNNKIVAAYSLAKTGWKQQNGLAIGLSLATAKQKIGTAAGIEQDDIYYSYVSGGIRTYLFLDTLDQNKVVGMLQRQDGLQTTAPRDGKLRDALELQLFDLVNAERAARGIPVLTWDKLANKSARLHSEDMRDKDYFSHTNKENETAFDRMEAQGIRFQYAAENIAAGQKDSFYAHYSFLNSESHRKSVLDAKQTKLGIGVALGGSYKQYYTQHFYKPL